MTTGEVISHPKRITAEKEGGLICGSFFFAHPNFILASYDKSFYIDICYFLWEEAIIGIKKFTGAFV